jgi:hypothetical protein
MPSIENMIDSLSPQQRFQFDKNLRDSLNDEDWCMSHGVNYERLSEKEDIPKAKEALYKEMFDDKLEN